jgi:anti-anti-sigma factor
MSAASSGFGIESEHNGPDTSIKVRGELDLSTAPALATALTEAAATEVATVTLDLGSITFIDSSALRVLVNGGRELSSSGKALQIGARSTVVSRVLAMTNLDTEAEAFRLLPD